ncbi:MAG TPA: molybdenum cofactor biosynthesis protein MoeB [Deltaproteobacteria bacterium]|nr:molybdenum cofactor biosynthesis protein MoeB [Deltaproteobacteria bacterium]
MTDRPSSVPESRERPLLDHADIARYSRHLILDQVGMEGQRTLKGASVLCVGAGGLGSPVLMYLAAAGVGRIGIVDFDVVDESNLQRQVIHGEATLGLPKAESARRRILELNPRCRVDLHPVALRSHNALEVLSPYDVVVDGTDNFPTRYLVNDACCLLDKPNIYGSIYKFEGQASVFNYRGGPSYRDLFPEPPPPGLVPSCAEGGVLGVLPGVIGSIQATETLKVLLDLGDTLSGRLLIYDALRMQFRELQLGRDPHAPPVTKLIDYDRFCGVVDSSEGAAPAVAPSSEGFERLSVETVRARLDGGWRPLWVDVRGPQEWDIVKLEEAVLFRHHQAILSEGLGDVPLDRPILVQCKSGGRSAKAAAALVARGFAEVYNLEGGINAWIRAFRPDLPTY